MAKARKVEDPEIKAMRTVAKSLGRIDRAVDAAALEFTFTVEGLAIGTRLRLLGFVRDRVVRSVEKIIAPFGATPVKGPMTMKEIEDAEDLDNTIAAIATTGAGLINP